MDQLVTGLAGNVAADELAVHADALAGNLQHPYLVTGDLLEALPHQVHTGSLLILADAAAEQIVGVYRGSHVRQVLQTKGLAREKVELALLKQILVATAITLFQYRHSYEYAD